MEKAKIEELFKKHNLEGKFSWSAGTVISDLIKEYLPKFEVRCDPYSFMPTISTSEFKEKFEELKNVVAFYNDVSGIEKKQKLPERDAIGNQVSNYWAIGILINDSQGKTVIHTRSLKYPRIYPIM